VASDFVFSNWLDNPYEAQTLLGLGVYWCRTRVVSDTDTTPTLVITRIM